MIRQVQKWQAVKSESKLYMEVLLRKLIQHNIRIEVVGEEIELSIPESFDATELIQEIKQNKAALVNFIKRSNSQNAFHNIKACGKKESYALSSAQKRLYFLQTFEEKTLAYNMSQVYVFDQQLEKAKILDAFQQLTQRHENLRTSFHMIAGEPRQKVHESVDFDIEYFEGNEDAILTFKEQFFRPFDLSQAPLIRVALIKQTQDADAESETEQILLVDTHHIISDGLSHNILLEDIMALYAGEKLAPLSLQYKDYAEWQQGELEGEKNSDAKAFWLQIYEEELSPLELPLDNPRPLLKTNEGASCFFSLNKSETQGLKQLAKEEGITMFILLLSVIKILLHKLSNQQDIVVGTLNSGRFHFDLERIIGILVNTVALRTHIDPKKPYAEFVKELHDQTYLAFEYHTYPYEELVNDLAIKRDPGRNPLFDLMFSFFDEQGAKEDASPNQGGKQAEELQFEIHQKSTFDIYLTAREKSDHIQFEFEYASSLFEKETITRFIQYFRKIITEVANYPKRPIHQIDILSEAEKQQLLFGFNNTEKSLPDSHSFSQLFQESVRKNSQGIAVEHNGNKLTYQELHNRSCQLATHLGKAGVQQGSKVVLFMPRSIDMLTSILAIYQLGGAYIPIDVYNPSRRVTEILVDSESPFVLSSTDYVDELENIQTEIPQELSIIPVDQLVLDGSGTFDFDSPIYQAHDLAYIIYTSGSTGKPKGVMIHQRGMINHLYAKIEDLNIDKEEVIAQTASPGFDISVWQFLAALLVGGKTFIIDKEVVLNPTELLDQLEKGAVSIFESVPSLMGAFLDRVKNDDAKPLAKMKWMLATGEPLSINLSKKWYASFPEIPLVNAYGPTEASDDVTHHTISFPQDEQVIPVGKPIQNIHIYILDDYLNLCPIGVRGQICVSGIGVGLGYWKNEEKTRKAFGDNPFAEHFEGNDYEKLYKTGDSGYLLSDGTLICEGRIDQQVKILGNRIELGEIEERLLKHPAIKEAALLAKSDASSTYLVAYYVSDESPGITELRSHLLEQLPDYMVPHYYVPLDKMPVTTSGKLNRKALPVPELTLDTAYIAPENETEKEMVRIWAEILNLEEEKIGITQNFFELGGHSLRAIFMANKILDTFQVKISLRDIFAFQDIQSLAKVIVDSTKVDTDVGQSSLSRIEQVEEQEFYPLSSAQLRMFLTQKLIKNARALNIYNEFEVPKSYSLEKVQSIFQQIIQRHESLRTSFHMQGNTPVQKVHEKLDFEITRISSESWERGDFSYDARFDLSQAPLLRVGLVEKEESNLLIVDMHHIISDGVSNALLAQEFQQLAKGERLADLPIQYKDYAVWQKAELESGFIKNQELYWMDVFKGDLPKLQLPGDQVILSPLNQMGASLSFQIGGGLFKKLKGISQEHKVPLFSVLMAINTLVLHKLSSQEDIIVGVPTAGRNHPHLEKVIGMFLNTIAIRLAPEKDKHFADFLRELADSMTEALENQDYQFDELIEKLKLKREDWKNPLFNVIMVLQNYLEEDEISEEQIEGVELMGENPEVPLLNDLFYSFTEAKDKILANIQYNNGLYTKDYILKMLRYFEEIVDAVYEAPDTLIKELHLSHSLEEAQLIELDDGFNF